MSVLAPPAPLAGPVIDTHTHLNLHDADLHGDAVPDPDELLRLAASVGVAGVHFPESATEYSRDSTLPPRSSVWLTPSSPVEFR